MDASGESTTVRRNERVDIDLMSTAWVTGHDLDPDLAVTCHGCCWSGILADTRPLRVSARAESFDGCSLEAACPDCGGRVYEAETPASAHFARPGTEYADVPVACESCRWIGRAGDTAVILDVEYRLVPGQIVPAGECPACGGLAHPRRDDRPSR